MSRVQIRQSHNKSESEVREVVYSVEHELATRFGLSTSWKNDHCVTFKRPGLSGELTMEPGCVTIDMKLGILLRLYSRTITQELEKDLASKLA